MEQVQKHLRIEEETRNREKDLNGTSSSKVNTVTQNNQKGKRKSFESNTTNSNSNKKKKKDLSEMFVTNVEERDTFDDSAAILRRTTLKEEMEVVRVQIWWRIMIPTKSWL